MLWHISLPNGGMADCRSQGIYHGWRCPLYVLALEFSDQLCMFKVKQFHRFAVVGDLMWTFKWFALKRQHPIYRWKPWKHLRDFHSYYESSPLHIHRTRTVETQSDWCIGKRDRSGFASQLRPRSKCSVHNSYQGWNRWIVLPWFPMISWILALHEKLF